MGKRSRQRSEQRAPKSERTPKPSIRERADRASRVAEKQIKARPPAPWDPFPLAEVAVLAGLILLIVGAVMGGQTGTGLIVSGVVLACIGGLETALREHLGGYRSHAGLLAGIASLATLIMTTAIFNIGVAIRAGIAITVFAIAFPTLRNSFIRKSGGRGVL